MTQRRQTALTKDWEAYHVLVAQALESVETALEVGCGDGAVAPFPWRLFPHVRLLGVDPDPTAASHPYAEQVFTPSASGSWPIESGSVDLLLARYVLEHVERPAAFLAEARRVLRPGGRFLFLTPNRLHPAVLASFWLPLRLKRRILQSTRGVETDDVFPTWYRMNTPATLDRLLQDAGFGEIRMETCEYEPCPYIAFCPAGAWAAMAYLQAVRRSGLERVFGASIVGEALLSAA